MPEDQSTDTRARTISPERRLQLQTLQDALGITFTDVSLLDEALTHSSFFSDRKNELTSARKPGRDYERLEFFGDAVLKFIVSEYLFHTYPSYDEGRLTEIRAVLVNAQTLEEVAREIGISEFIVTGRGIPMRGSMLARSMEAILGAVYLDSGLDSSRRLITGYFCSRAGRVDKDRLKSNYKAQLQQLTQGRSQGIPVYSVLQVDGPPHDPTFTVSVSIAERRIAEGTGHSKKTAEQAAAKAAFLRLHEEQEKAPEAIADSKPSGV